MDDRPVDVHHDCNCPHDSGPHDEVLARDDTRAVRSVSEERPGESSLIHGVQVHDEVKGFHLSHRSW